MFVAPPTGVEPALGGLENLFATITTRWLHISKGYLGRYQNKI